MAYNPSMKNLRNAHPGSMIGNPLPRTIRFLMALFLLGAAFAQATVIKSGMMLNIVVKNDKDLSQIVRVNDNGTIDYPLYQDISVVDKTTSELQDILTYKLAKVVESPMVLVSVMTENPITLYILGQVKKPGLVMVPPKSSLQEVLLAAGGSVETADLNRVKIVHKNQGDENASYYDLQKFLNSGDLTLLPSLMDGDRIILLSSKKSKYVKILGSVQKPGFYPIGESASVFDMLYLAGGPATDANMSKVRIISSPGGQKADFLLDMQKFIDDGKTDDLPLLSEGDMMIVYAKTITWTKTLEMTRDIVALLTAWFVISSVLKK
ncbi:MAG: polysaccharide export protein [Fibrobacteres bacterium]|nr:polysaccharide export protein [Fibrobacterota bacterium]